MFSKWPDKWVEYIEKNLPDIPPATLILAANSSNLEGFVKEISRIWLCQNSRSFKEFVCKNCKSCTWCFNDSHPDLKLIVPPNTNNSTSSKITSKGEIRIDQIKELNNFFNLTSHQNGFRITCIGPANKLNYPAANALLKILEEPQIKLRFILFSDSLRGIPPTLLSRCRKLVLPTERSIFDRNLYAADENIVWLLPLLRESFAKIDPVQWSIVAGKTKPIQVLNILLMWMLDVARVNLGIKSVCFPKEMDALLSTSNSLKSLTNWVESMFKIQDMIRYADHTLNITLFYESIFYEYLDGFN